MGFLSSIFDLIKLAFTLTGKCLEYIFISILFSTPIYFVYDLMFFERFSLPKLFYIDFVAILFVLELLLLLHNIVGGSVERGNKVIVLPKIDKIEKDKENI